MKPMIRKVGGKALAAVLLPVLVYAFFAVLRPGAFLSLEMPITLLNQSLSTIVLAWGMSFGMMIGNMDMSCSAEQILGSILAIMLSNRLGAVGLVLGVVINAVVIGMIKAVLMAIIDIKSRVISIAYTLILGSVGYLITGGEAIKITTESFLLSNVYVSLVVFAAAGVIMYALHRYSLFGAQCKALSGNEALALSSGINKKKVEGIAIMVCSAYIAVSAFLSILRGGGASPMSGLLSLSNVFSAMSGVFIAMALQKSLSVPIGIIVGSYTMNIIIMGVIALNMPSQLRTTVIGGFLLVLMLFIEIKGKRAAEKMRRAAATHLLALT